MFLQQKFSFRLISKVKLKFVNVYIWSTGTFRDAFCEFLYNTVNAKCVDLSSKGESRMKALLLSP